MRKSETLNLRVSSEFKQRLVEEAKKEKRSVTNYIEAILTAIWGSGRSTDAGFMKRSKKSKPQR
jgi:hypothetical protein